ncbi:alpha/beta hydrolase [Acinetobacter silvestris]|uniref:Serine aminopeptidase S33 domain-containing protein n=1 Tax=Acinetobacter silvestris TaxID=1977882 RepID=A0A1Y3CJ54_9GAMM|nr:alpha/beta fold hydrolase [Acinetobacter silvestris]OTG65173.1 hypothetical protein B9T28_10325 [Acinetobacter silvestris]
MNIDKLWIPVENDQIQADYYHNPRNASSATIIMAHGLAGEKQYGLDFFAQAYQDIGYNVCVFDHRGFGQSTGKVKNLVDKNSQLQDWYAAIAYLESNLNIKKNNMILWGYSFSGAHVLMLASTMNFKGIIANFPHVDGLASLALYPKKYLIPASLYAIQDLVYQSFGKVKTMPVVDPQRFAILAGEDCYEGYHSIIPTTSVWDNAVPARIIASIGFYRPTRVVHKIQSPTLVIGAQQDSLIPIQATRKMVQKNQNIEYYEEYCGHFDLFKEPYKSQLMQQHHHFMQSL